MLGNSANRRAARRNAARGENSHHSMPRAGSRSASGLGRINRPNGVVDALAAGGRALRDRRFFMAIAHRARFSSALPGAMVSAGARACASPRGNGGAQKAPTERNATMPRFSSVHQYIAPGAHIARKPYSGQSATSFLPQAPAATQAKIAGALCRMKMRFCECGAPMPRL